MWSILTRNFQDSSTQITSGRQCTEALWVMSWQPKGSMKLFVCVQALLRNRAGEIVSDCMLLLAIWGVRSVEQSYGIFITCQSLKFIRKGKIRKIVVSILHCHSSLCLIIIRSASVPVKNQVNFVRFAWCRTSQSGVVPVLTPSGSCSRS